MNAHVHTPSLGDEIFDFGDALTSTPTSNTMAINPVNTSSNIYRQTPPSTKHMIKQNTSDEYYTANEESFSVTSNVSMNNSQMQQNNGTPNNIPSGGQSGTHTTGPTTMAARKQMVPLDQNEPAKPLSAYALFFRDTVSAIKQQNPTCSFQELSKIVASMWDALDPAHKGVYNKKNEVARTEYLKQMRIYQQQQQLKQDQLSTNSNESLQTQTNVQQQTTAQVTSQSPANNGNSQETTDAGNNNSDNSNINTPATVSLNSGAPSDEQTHLLTEDGSAQKCTRDNCNKRAIINPDWEDEYCSNECVIIHCRNVFNSWVQSNLESKLLQQETTTI